MRPYHQEDGSFAGNTSPPCLAIQMGGDVQGTAKSKGKCYKYCFLRFSTCLLEKKMLRVWKRIELRCRKRMIPSLVLTQQMKHIVDRLLEKQELLREGRFRRNQSQKPQQTPHATTPLQRVKNLLLVKSFIPGQRLPLVVNFE